jgi:CheY-like chemotaxis protein
VAQEVAQLVRIKAFEPFLTTKEVGKGSGLGLSQVLGFAKQSGGGVRLESRLGEGTSIHIYLPRAAADAGKPQVLSRSSHAHAPLNATILLVDDDIAVREVTAALLRDLGYAVVEVGSGGGALDLLERVASINLMLIDFAMPGMNGAELARQVQARRPSLPILLVTGFADRAGLAAVSDEHIIGKPFLDDELATKVRNALSASLSGNVIRLRG